MRSAAVVVGLLAIGCSCATKRPRTPAPTVAPTPSGAEPERAAAAAPEPPGAAVPQPAPAEPTLSVAARPRPSIVRGEGDDYCVLETDATAPSWRCLDPSSPLQGDSDTIDIDVDGWNPSCRLHGAKTLTCTSPHLPDPVSFTEVDAFATNGMQDRLCVLRSGDVACGMVEGGTLPLSSLPALKGSVQIGVMQGEVCGLSALGLLRCLDPDEPEFLTQEADAVEAYAAGESHACVIRKGAVACWGTATTGEIGDGSTLPTNWFTERMQSEPVVVVGPKAPRALALGGAFSCALDGDGRVWCWGADARGTLGRGLLHGASSQPEPVWDLIGVVELRAWNESVCARLDDGALRCWGSIGDRWPAAPSGYTTVALDPRSPPRARYPLVDTCATRDLTAWAAAVEDASDSLRVVELLAALGMDPAVSRIALPNALPLHVSSVEVHEVQLDGTGPTERVVEVLVTAQEHERRMVAFLRAGDPAVADQWCPIEGAAMASSSILDMRPCLEHDDEPAFEGGLDVSFVELTAAGKQAVEVRRQDGACGGYPRDSKYQTEYWELQGDTLVRIFGPFTTFEESHSVVADGPWTHGFIQLSGGFPKRIVTKTTVEWYDDEDDEGDADAGRTVTKRRTWRFRGGRYR